MISSIKIADTFTEINEEYRKFKNIISNKWCEANELSFQIEEENLISQIKSVLKKTTNNQLESENDIDNNLMRVLIASKTLSNFTLLNQDQCVNFFTEIEKKLPDSIPKRRFFFKCVAKIANNKSHYLWDNFIYNFHDRILPMNKKTQTITYSISDILIYISFLIQYAPDFVCLFSIEIFYHLFRIIQQEEYILDLNYDILSITNETIDTYFAKTDDNKKYYYANYAIELLRLIFSKINLVRYQTIEISQILEWDTTKTLATLLVILENCPESFIKNHIDLIYQFLIKIDQTNPEFNPLLIRNIILCSLIKEDSNTDIIKSIFSFNDDKKSNFVSGKLLNLKLLIDKNHPFLDDDSFDCQIVITYIFDNIDSDQKTLKNNAFDLLNSCLSFNIEQNETLFETDDEFISKLKKQDLIFDFPHVIDLLIKNDQNQSFFNSLIQALNTQSLETLQFLNKFNELSEIFINFFKNLPDQDKDQIARIVCNLFDAPNPEIKSLVPFVLAKISPNLLFSNPFLTDVLNSLVKNSNEKVKLSILKCFIEHLNNENFNNYPNFNFEINQLKAHSIFKILLNDNSPRKVQIETIKFVCKLSQLGLDFYEIISPYLNYFSSFSKEKIKNLVGFDHYFIFPQKLAIISESLPFIFESYSSCFTEFFQPFYNFALDYMNCAANNGIESTKHVELQTKAVQKTYFQRKFFKTTFRSFIESLKIIHRKNPSIFQRNYKDVINFCSINLQNKMDELETQCILSLLEQILSNLGFDWIHQNYDSSSINSLFVAVFETGSRFASPLIHQLVFKILGFLGAQIPEIKEAPIYICEVDKKSRLSRAILDLKLNGTPFNYITMYYLTCFYSVLDILEDESVSYLHFLALEALIKITTELKISETKNHLIICMNYFNKMLNKSEGHDKKKFVPLLNLMLTIERTIISAHILEFCRLFVDLWEYGSIDILKPFTEIFGSLLVPCLEMIIHLIQGLDDVDSVIDNLIMIFINCYNGSSYNYFDIDIIDILIQMGNNGHYQVFKRLTNLSSRIYSLTTYYPSILQMCLKYVCSLNQLSQEDQKFFDDATDLILKLISAKTDHLLIELLPSFKPQIIKAFAPYPEKLNKIENALENGIPKSIFKSSQMIGSNSKSSKEVFVFLSNDKKEKLLKLVTRINDYINDEINPLYIKQWLNELILFCIKNSPVSIIKNTYLVAKSNNVFASSLFNISFHSFFSCQSNRPNESISKTFLNVLKHKNTPDHCKAMLIELIEFMDKYSYPLFKPEDFKCPLNLIFSSNPTITLQYSIRSFESLIKNAESDLQLAFLNVGSIDEYRQFSKLFNMSSYNEKKYQFPIFTGSQEESHNLEIANNLFKNKMWDEFDSETEQFNKKTIAHLFKAAKEIYINKNESSDDVETRIENALKEIDLGFDSLGLEGGPQFNQGFTSVLQSIIYAQQLTELKEMAISKSDQFHLRMANSTEIISFLPPILLLRIAAKGDSESSLAEKLELLSLCRKSNRWESMKMYNDFFGFNDENSPIEVQYEMMHYKMANNSASEEDFDSIIQCLERRIKEEGDKNPNQLSKDYKYSNLVKFTKYNKASFLSHSQAKDEKWKSVIELCNNFDNADAINLQSWVNLKIFELNNDRTSLNNAIQLYIDATIRYDKYRIPNLLHMIYLLFTYFNNDDNDDSVSSIEKILNKIPLHFYLDVMSQFMSYVPNLKENSFKKYVMNILNQMMIKYPHGVIYHYMFSLFCDKTNINGVIVHSPIKEIKDKINNPLFEEAQEMISTLERANHDYFVSIIFFFRYFYAALDKSKVSNKEDYKLQIKKFYPKILAFINDLIIPLDNYYKHLPGAYEPILSEIDRLKNFQKSFYLIKQRIENYKELIQKYLENDIEININEIRSYFHDFLKNNRDYTLTAKFFSKHSQKVADICDLKLPIFGTYHYNEKPILINKFEDEFKSEQSLKAPKRIKIKANDGHSYCFIMKQSEDLRSDERVMIFHKFLNRFISTKIRTFSITPLTPHLGMVQFVDNTKGVSDLIQNYRKKRERDDKKTLGYYITYETKFVPLRSYKEMTVIQRFEYFKEMTKNKENGEDLKNSFCYFTPNSETWYKFVKNFAQTCAVTSIAGYILGLGDRHLENIMIDVLNGSLIHIDFNDLFEIDQMKIVNKDMVPFRLTRNLVEALGPCGTKGIFSLKCEETLSVVRENREVILNILKVFVDSPIYAQNRTFIEVDRTLSDIEQNRKSADKAMKRVAKKVNGTDIYAVYSLDDDLDNLKNIEPISVHDHVIKLIECATDEYHLASGFYGWQPWI